MLTVPCNQTIRWMGIEVRAPREWQVVRHGLSPSRGQLALIDRYRQRMTLNWTQCGGEPDLERMIEDYRARQLESHREADITDLESAAGWRGTQRLFEQSGQVITQAVRYDDATRRLVEVWIATAVDAAEENGLVEAILAGVEVVEPADAVTRWRGFDVDVTLPADEGQGRGPASWRLQQSQVKPADVKLTWIEVAPARWRKVLPTGSEVTVRRMGMADVWYDGDGEAFLRRQFRRSNGGPAQGWHRGRRVTEARGWEAGPPLKRLLGRLRRRQDVVWHCEACNAVFHLSVRSFRKRLVEAEAFDVRCEAGHA